MNYGHELAHAPHYAIVTMNV